MIQIGKQIGNFLIKGEIGKGGMGTIYYAVDTMLNRDVALKVIHPQLATNDQLMERFKIEAMTQAQMNHPNVVLVFSFNKLENQYIIAMELVDGKSLKEILRERSRLSIKESIHIIKQVLKGLDYAHSHKIIHRDIKPANIMITKNNTVKLSDFGIAKVFGKQGLTKTGMLIGTPWYTSPEQILGKDIDFRSDLYSAGITFYEMLTSRVPFDSKTNSEFQIQKAHLETPPPRPSIYNADIGTKVEKFILKSLQKKQDKRFQNATEMIADLEKIEKTLVETTILSGDGYTHLEETNIPRKSKRWTPLNVFSILIVLLFITTSAIFINKRFIQPKKDEKKILQTASQEIPTPSATVSAKSDNIAQSKSEVTLPAKESKDPKPDERKKETSPYQKIKKNPTPKIQPKTENEAPVANIPKKSQPMKQTSTPKSEITEKSNQDVIKQETQKITEQEPIEKSEPSNIQQTPQVNIDAELFAIKNMIRERQLKKAEIQAEELLKKANTPRVNGLVGSIKFFRSNFTEAEKYWRITIENKGEIPIRFYHKHGVFNKGCSGQLILKKNMIIFNSSTKPEHSFALPKEKILKVHKPKNEFGIEIKAQWKGKVVRNSFILFLKNNRRGKEKFLSGFINKYILGG